MNKDHSYDIEQNPSILQFYNFNLLAKVELISYRKLFYWM